MAGDAEDETGGMKPPPDPHYRHRFPAEIISHAVWLYHVFSLSLRDVELLLAERRVIVSYETVRRWVLKFGPLIAESCGRSPTPERAMAPRRDGRPDRRQAYVPVARGR